MAEQYAQHTIVRFATAGAEGGMQGRLAGVGQWRAPAFTQASVSPAAGFGSSNVVAEARCYRRAASTSTESKTCHLPVAQSTPSEAKMVGAASSQSTMK